MVVGYDNILALRHLERFNAANISGQRSVVALEIFYKWERGFQLVDEHRSGEGEYGIKNATLFSRAVWLLNSSGHDFQAGSYEVCSRLYLLSSGWQLHRKERGLVETRIYRDGAL